VKHFHLRSDTPFIELAGEVNLAMPDDVVRL